MPEDQTKVLTEFAAKMADRARKAHLEVEKLKSALGDAEKHLRICQQSCPHLRIKDHPRTCAEADSWEECIDCGATVY